MDQVYYLQQDDTATPLQRIACRNEDRELQRLLERNLHLLPTSQISPEKQLRWLLVKREMPVINPASGAPDWSIDFLLLDQEGVPTLVECKRRDDPRSKCEVIGQMIKYAANGLHYWTAAELHRHAQNTAGAEAILNEALTQLTCADITASEFFERAEENMKRSRMRLIFFLEESPFELRSMVEFLNGQFKETEVLIVEARQYSYGENRLVIPWVFGFTERARAAKKEAKAEATRTSIVKGEAAFWDSLESSLTDKEQPGQVRQFFAEVALIPNVHVHWLKSGLIKMPTLLPGCYLFSVRGDGSIEVNLAAWWPSKFPVMTLEQIKARAIFSSSTEAIFGISVSVQEEKQYRMFSLEKWLGRKGDLLHLLRNLGDLCGPVEMEHDTVDVLTTT